MLYTIIYFAVVAILCVLLVLLTIRKGKRISILGVFSAAMIFTAGIAFYSLFFENYMARNYGGSATVKIPENAQMIGMTWKGNSLWYQYYIPSTNECIFREDSSIGLLEGDVRTPNCNPVGVSR